MEIHISGVRRLSAGALAARRHRVEGGVSRKDLSSAAREAMEALDLRPAARQVLGILVGCYGEQQLARGLMVWPSNDYLTGKTGLSERTIRRSIRELVDQELVEPVDSANRKRFAIRSGGEIVDAYGFNLAAIYARRLEFTHQLLEQKVRRDETGRQFDQITICRKAVEEVLRALELHFPRVDHQAFAKTYADLVIATPRRSRRVLPLENLVERWKGLRTNVEDLFFSETSKKKESANPGPDDRHKESNNGWSSDPCQPSGVKRAETSVLDDAPLALVTEACPTLLTFGKPLRDEMDLIKLGEYLRSSISAHPSAWNEAEQSIGALKAALIVCIILQKHEDDVNSGRNQIKSPGGLFRDTVRRCAAGQFDIANELKAMRRRHMG